MTIIFDNEMNPDTVADFCDELSNKIYSLREGDWIDVYIATNGGVSHTRHPMVNALVKYQDYIKVFINFEMFSNGFVMLMELAKYNIPIYMTKDFMYSMIHKSDAQMYNHRPIGYEPIGNAHIKKYNTIIANELKKLGLTDEQIDRFKRGEDLYFSAQETLNLFPNIKLLK
jgi:hypothetical protein